MSHNQGFIQPPADTGVGKKVATYEVKDALGNLVERQGIVITDSDDETVTADAHVKDNRLQIEDTANRRILESLYLEVMGLTEKFLGSSVTAATSVGDSAVDEDDGSIVYDIISAGSTNAGVISTGWVQLVGWSIWNNAASTRFVKLHDLTSSSAPIAGVGVALTIGVPAGSGSNISLVPRPANFKTGMGITTVTGIALTDATAVTANDLAVNIFYKAWRSI